MKSHQLYPIITVLLIIPLIFSCNKNDDSDPVAISVEQESEVTETSFTINWSVSSSDIEKITIEISKDKSLETDLKIIEVSPAVKKVSIKLMTSFFRLISVINFF